MAKVIDSAPDAAKPREHAHHRVIATLEPHEDCVSRASYRDDSTAESKPIGWGGHSYSLGLSVAGLLQLGELSVELSNGCVALIDFAEQVVDDVVAFLHD